MVCAVGMNDWREEGGRKGGGGRKREEGGREKRKEEEKGKNKGKTGYRTSVQPIVRRIYKYSVLMGANGC